MSGWLLSVIWLVLALVASFKGADPAYFMGFLILANLTRPDRNPASADPIDSTAWATVQPGTVDQVAAILRVHYDHPDGEGSVECVCGGYEGPGDIFDHQAERIIAALGITVADAPAADDEGGQER